MNWYSDCDKLPSKFSQVHTSMCLKKKKRNYKCTLNTVVLFFYLLMRILGQTKFFMLKLYFLFFAFVSSRMIPKIIMHIGKVLSANRSNSVTAKSTGILLFSTLFKNKLALSWGWQTFIWLPFSFWKYVEEHWLSFTNLKIFQASLNAVQGWSTGSNFLLLLLLADFAAWTPGILLIFVPHTSAMLPLQLAHMLEIELMLSMIKKFKNPQIPRTSRSGNIIPFGTIKRMDGQEALCLYSAWEEDKIIVLIITVILTMIKTDIYCMPT